MKRKLAVALPILFIFSILITPLVSAWTLVTQTGYWKICTRNHWVKEGWCDGYAEWNETVESFNGYWFKVETVTWENWREWWQFNVLYGETSNDFWYKIKVETESGTLWVVTHYHGWTSWFGLIQGVQVNMGASSNASDWEDVELSYATWEGYDYFSVQHWNPTSFQLFIKKEGEITKVYWFFDIPNQQRKYLVEKQANVSLGTSGIVTLIYQHGGQGKIDGYAYDSFELPSFPPFETKGGGSGWLDWFASLATLDYGAIISTLLVCVTIFFTFVKLSLPILGFLALFWILDCIISGIVHGEPRIIGDMMMKIYDFLRGVWQTLVNIANAIWDFITFWS